MGHADGAASSDGDQHRREKKRKKKKDKKNKEEKKMRVTMEYIATPEDRVAPIVGYFPSGYNIFNNHNEVNPPEVEIYRNKQRLNRLELVVRPQDSNVEFVGTSYRGEATEPQLCKYSIGIFDKKNSTLKIVPIAANKIFRMEPIIKGSNDEEEKVEELTGEMARERFRELASLYGSKKNKNMLKKFVKMSRQDNDPDAQEYLKKEMENVEVNTKLLKNASEIVPNIPPYDPSAEVPEKAYILDKIIPKAEWSYLIDILEILESGDDASSSQNFEELGYPSFVAKRITQLQEIKDEEGKKKYARILSYITHLVNFLKLSLNRHFFRTKIEAGTTADYIPQVVFQRFVYLFVDPVSRNISSEKKELLIGYILVLTLFADNFKTLPDEIAKDLQMTRPSLRPFFRQLGCSFEAEGFKSFCVLKVPLVFPGALLHRRPPKRR